MEKISLKLGNDYYQIEDAGEELDGLLSACMDRMNAVNELVIQAHILNKIKRQGKDGKKRRI